MSRLARKPMTLPSGVTLEQGDRQVTVKGPKGSVTFHWPRGVQLKQDGDVVTVDRLSDSKADRSAQGTAVRILGNGMRGVVEQYRRALEVVGVGYQVNQRGQSLAFKVGFANEIVLEIPADVQVDLPSATKVVLTGCDKHSVGQFAANIRRVRPPEPYNGKGIRYEGERIQRKAGKSFTSAG